MLIQSLVHNGVGYTMMTSEQLLAVGVPAAAVTEAEAAIRALAERDAVRAEIAANAGDIPSLLGTTADVAALALIGIMQIVIILAEKGSVDVKAAIAASAIPMPIEKAKTLIAAIADGSVKVPALIKGIDTVYAEVAARSTATAVALANEALANEGQN